VESEDELLEEEDDAQSPAQEAAVSPSSQILLPQITGDRQ
jgi:hypothetical protein